MEYKGIELKEVTEQQIFEPPKKMFVWDKDSVMNEHEVYAIVSSREFPVICRNSVWRHCAEITEPPLATYRELARWLAEGNGEVVWENNVLSNWNYSTHEENKALDESLSVRKWDDTEWHKPTREYLGLDD